MDMFVALHGLLSTRAGALSMHLVNRTYPPPPLQNKVRTLNGMERRKMGRELPGRARLNIVEFGKGTERAAAQTS